MPKRLPSINQDKSKVIAEYRNAFGNYHNLSGPSIIKESGAEYWFKDGYLHRDDGPAVIDKDGNEFYYYDGILHRDDGPAKVTADNEQYYINGKLHNETGYAVKSFYNSTLDKYALDDKLLTFSEWIKRIPNKFTYLWKLYIKGRL